MKIKKKYDANFTAGGLFHREFKAISSILCDADFILQINQERELNEILGIPMESARKRIISEIKRRYEIVDKSYWDWFIGISEVEQRLALYFLCLKTYPIVFDLHREVALKKFKIGNKLDAYSVQMRLDELSATDSDIETWSDLTLDKINSQFRTTLKDCGLLDDMTLISPMGVSQSFWAYYDSIEEAWFKEMCFN